MVNLLNNDKIWINKTTENVQSEKFYSTKHLSMEKNFLTC